MSDSYDPLAAYATPSWRDRATAVFQQPAAWLTCWWCSAKNSIMLPAVALKQYRDAMADYDHVLALRPEHPRALLQKAVLLQAMNQPQEAGILLKRSCALGERLACGKS
ncbi:MAG: tetratricopeptide repeat protein [Pseudomonadota bacterium]